jgi:hypothetical protein
MYLITNRNLGHSAIQKVPSNAFVNNRKANSTLLRLHHSIDRDLPRLPLEIRMRQFSLTLKGRIEITTLPESSGSCNRRLNNSYRYSLFILSTSVFN